jgi:hypothetical protein
VVKEVRLGVETLAAGLEDAQVDVPPQVEQVGEGIRLGDAEVVPRHQTQPAAADQEVAEVFDDAADAALQDEGDGEVGVPGPVQAGPQVGQEGVLASAHQRLPVREVGRPPGAGQVVRAGGYHVANAAARVGDVAGVAGDDVDVEVKDRLARGGADVPADVEPVGPVLLQDLVPGDRDRGDQLLLLRGSGLPPGGDVAAGDEEGVPGGHREGVPEAEGELATVEDSLPGRATEGAGRLSHGQLRRDSSMPLPRPAAGQ